MYREKQINAAKKLHHGIKQLEAELRTCRNQADKEPNSLTEQNVRANYRYKAILLERQLNDLYPEFRKLVKKLDLMFDNNGNPNFPEPCGYCNGTGIGPSLEMNYLRGSSPIDMLRRNECDNCRGTGEER